MQWILKWFQKPKAAQQGGFCDSQGKISSKVALS